MDEATIDKLGKILNECEFLFEQNEAIETSLKTIARNKLSLQRTLASNAEKIYKFLRQSALIVEKNSLK